MNPLAPSVISSDSTRPCHVNLHITNGEPVNPEDSIVEIGPHLERFFGCSGRVLKANGELMPKIAGGLEAQAVLLRSEGFVVDDGGEKPKIKAFKDKLFAFN